jgi:hypothetical protein
MENERIPVVFLGTSMTGKSTALKHCRIAYTDDRIYFSKSQSYPRKSLNDRFPKLMREQIIKHAKLLARTPDTTGATLEDDHRVLLHD